MPAAIMGAITAGIQALGFAIQGPIGWFLFSNAAAVAAFGAGTALPAVGGHQARRRSAKSRTDGGER